MTSREKGTEEKGEIYPTPNPERYYLDTCIWRDYFENRLDRFRPLGEWAFLLLKKITRESNLIIYSDLVEEELSSAFSEEDVNRILAIMPEQLLEKIEASSEQLAEAKEISGTMGAPIKDVMHAILARDSNSILVTRDKHFRYLSGIVSIKKPEELI